MATDPPASPVKRTWKVNGDKITKLRIEKGWSIEVLAKRASLSAKRLLQIIKGGSAFPNTIGCIAEALGISAKELIADPLPAPATEQKDPYIDIILRIPLSHGLAGENSFLAGIFKNLEKLISAQGEIKIIGTTDGSIIVKAEMIASDFLRLMDACEDFRFRARFIASVMGFGRAFLSVTIDLVRVVVANSVSCLVASVGLIAGLVIASMVGQATDSGCLAFAIAAFFYLFIKYSIEPLSQFILNCLPRLTISVPDQPVLADPALIGFTGRIIAF